MRYLLDTHTYFRWNDDPSHLPKRVEEILASPDSELVLSVVTPWELAIKTNRGRLKAMPLLIDFEERETAAGFIVVRPTAAQAIRSGLFPLHHKDPFDRLLAAQALDLNAILLSRDTKFDFYGVSRVWN